METEETYNDQNERPKPIVKWAGGKNQLLKQFERLFPKSFDNYIEPFVGGGAVYFYLSPPIATIIDNNFDLINFYRVLRDNIDDLLRDLDRHKNKKDYFYFIRKQNPDELSPTQRASRFLFLNKTGYNGLWRVNKKGMFNVPYGKYKNPNFKDTENLKLVHKALQKTNILHGDFELALEYIKPNTFIYVDPPYHPISNTSNFTSYTSNSFDSSEQERLAHFFRKIDELGCYAMLSNSDTALINDLYSDYRIEKVFARRAINCKGDERGPIAELVIRNYD